MASTKLDLYVGHKDEYRAPKTPALIRTKPASYLGVDGSGSPGDALFQSRIMALYGMAYTIKFASKLAGRDFAVCKLEGLYGLGAPSAALSWKLLIRVPGFIRDEHLAQARETLARKDKAGDFEQVRLERIDEGLCVQMLHVGPYDREQPTIDAMLACAVERGYRPTGAHHEIYLSDPRRVPPERLRTILRQPVRPA